MFIRISMHKRRSHLAKYRTQFTNSPKNLVNNVRSFIHLIELDDVTVYPYAPSKNHLRFIQKKKTKADFNCF